MKHKLQRIASSARLAGLLLGGWACASHPTTSVLSPGSPAASTYAASPPAGLRGFAAENGTTTGGAAGRTVAATTLAELTALAKSAEPLEVV